MISLITLLVTKKIKIKNAIISLLIIGVIVLPIILFLGINTFDKPEIKIGNITVPRLSVNRYQEVTSIFSKDFLNKSLENFINGIKIIATQSDGNEYNTLKFFGAVYIISIPFMILGIVISFSKEKRNLPFYILLHSWLISSFIFLFICEPNINRCNIIMFLMIIYTAIGLGIVVKVSKKVSIPIILLYVISFTLFNLKYFNIIDEKGAVFESDIEEMVQYVSKKQDKTIYITDKIKDAYIYFLFFNKENPFEYRNTAGIVDESWEFQEIYKYENYVFYIPKQVRENSVIVFDKNEEYTYDESKFKKTEFKRFIVLEEK